MELFLFFFPKFQAPPQMRSVMASMWQLTVAFGNLIVVIITELKIFPRQVYRDVFLNMLSSTKLTENVYFVRSPWSSSSSLV